MIGSVVWEEDGLVVTAILRDDLTWSVPIDPAREEMLTLRYHAFPGDPRSLNLALARGWLRALAAESKGQVTTLYDPGPIPMEIA